MQRALEQEWSFVQTVVLYQILDIFLRNWKILFVDLFFSKLFGDKILPQIRSWVSVPIRQGGTAIPKPEEMVDLNYQASKCGCSHLIDSLKGREMFDVACHTNTMASVRARINEEKVVKADKILDGLKYKMNKFGDRKLD